MNMLWTWFQDYLLIHSFSTSTSPPEFSLAAFFFVAFELDFFEPFLEAFLGAGLAGVSAFNLLSRK